MRKTKLSSSEIQDLINKYKSELKKLEFQTEQTNSTISELEDWLESVDQSEKSALAKMGGKKKIVKQKSVATRTTKKGRGRPPTKEKKVAEKSAVKTKKPTRKSRAKKGYKLSNWDKWLIESISEKGKPMLTQELIDSVKVKVQSAGLQSNDEEVKNKVTRSLQKLANRRNDVVKVPYKGKGFAYGVPGMSGTKGKSTRKTKTK